MGGAPHDRHEEFEAVALPHVAALYNLALSLTRDRTDAEDLVQEAMLRAYRFFDSYQAGTQIKAWLFRILRNTFINRYRAARSRPPQTDFAAIEGGYEALIEEAFPRSRSSATPEALLLEGALDEELERALADLSEEYRTVVILALVEELSYREIATVLGIPTGTVMSRLHRGRKRLQAALLDYAKRKGITRPSPTVDSHATDDADDGQESD